MRNVSDTIYRKSQNMHLMFSNVCTKIMPFMW